LDTSDHPEVHGETKQSLTGTQLDRSFWRNH